MPQSICVISEDLSVPIDEGIKSFAHSLIRSWSADYSVLGLSVRSEVAANVPYIASVKTNKLLLSYKLRAKIRQFRPNVICYVPSASATVFSFLRSRVLKFYWPHAKVVMVSLQPYSYSRSLRYLIRLLSPDMIFAQSEEALRQFASVGCPTRLLPSGVDLDKFTPVSSERKTELRVKYGLEPEAFTVLHVGHIRWKRNIELMMQIPREDTCQIVLVGSSLPHPIRNALITRLRRRGVMVFDKYFPNIEELYQLSDCYLFPVFSDHGCIGVPLSILEAMACNLPVVSVRYGSLPILFKEEHGLLFADTPEELLQGINKVKKLNGCQTREKVTSYSWQNIAKNLLEQIRANNKGKH